VIRRFQYDHPVFDAEAMDVQQRVRHLSGRNRTHYCGAYWGYGFHEDGVVSALSALERFESDQDHAERYLQRAS